MQWKSNDTFYKTLYDRVIFYPILEMSCGKQIKIPEVTYFYNFATGSNDYINN